MASLLLPSEEPVLFCSRRVLLTDVIRKDGDNPVGKDNIMVRTVLAFGNVDMFF